MEAFGRGLILEPYLATVVLGGGLVRLAGDEAQRAAILPKIADGSLLLAFAHSEAQSRYDLADVSCTARRDADGWVLDGAKSFVAHGDRAEKLIVSARIGGDRRSREGIVLFLVDAQAGGVTCRGYPTDGCVPPRSGHRAEGPLQRCAFGSRKAAPVIERGSMARLPRRRLGRGAMSAAHEITIDYLKTRKSSSRDRQLPGVAAPRGRSAGKSDRHAVALLSP
jgi:alkylation response protein AidB-like acyl-CoA dehydrogenase